MSALPSLAIPEHELAADLCRNSFEFFVRQFWETIPGTGKLVWNWHLKLLCDELQLIAERVIDNQPKEYDLVINVSPGSSKSSIASILFHPWMWTRMCNARFLTASHTSDLVMDLSSKSRDVLRSEKYVRFFPEIELRDDTLAKGHYRNTHGGERKICTASGVSPLGFHANCIICDDIVDPKEILSDVKVQTAKHFLEEVIPSRVVDKAVTPIILIMQRLGLKDPTDVMLRLAEKEGAYPVRHICLPAELTDDVKPPSLRKFYANGLMDPIRLSKRTLDNFKSRNNLFYSTQFLQHPYAQEGAMFKRHHFSNRVKAAPYEMIRVRAWDRASGTSESSCYTAGILLGLSRDGRWYVEHMERGQWEPDERNDRIKAIAIRDRTKYGPKYDPLIYIESEGGSSGRDAWKAIARHLAGFRVFEYHPTGSKDLRAEPWACSLASGLVYLVDNGDSEGTGKADWDIEYFIEEHLAFKLEPGKKLGRLKDVVDSVSMGHNILVNKGRLSDPLRIFTFGKKVKGVIKIVVCPRDVLPSLEIADHPCLLFSLVNPGENPPLPDHAIKQLLDGTVMSFADLDPKDHMEDWSTSIAENIFTIEHGKKLWNTILKKRSQQWEVLLIADEGTGDNRALSLALGICDSLHLDRSKTIWQPALTPGGDSPLITKEVTPSNRYLYDMVRNTRNMVIG